MIVYGLDRKPWRQITLSEMAVAADEYGQPKRLLAGTTPADVREACRRRGVVVRDGRFFSSYIPNVVLELGRMAQERGQ